MTACNNDGVWNSLGANVKLSLQPHFWQTWWFSGFCALAGVAFVGGSARYVTRRRMQRRLVALEQQNALEKERTRIAQDIQDDLGTTLTQITLLSDAGLKNRAHPEEVGQNLEKISAKSRELGNRWTRLCGR